MLWRKFMRKQQEEKGRASIWDSVVPINPSPSGPHTGASDQGRTLRLDEVYRCFSETDQSSIQWKGAAEDRIFRVYWLLCCSVRDFQFHCQVEEGMLQVTGPYLKASVVPSTNHSTDKHEYAFRSLSLSELSWMQEIWDCRTFCY